MCKPKPANSKYKRNFCCCNLYCSYRNTWSIRCFENQVIGIPQSDSYTVPKKYQKAIKVGNAMSPDMEKISNLNPDLILSPNSLESDLASK